MMVQDHQIWIWVWAWAEQYNNLGASKIKASRHHMEVREQAAVVLELGARVETDQLLLMALRLMVKMAVLGGRSNLGNSTGVAFIFPMVA